MKNICLFVFTIGNSQFEVLVQPTPVLYVQKSLEKRPTDQNNGDNVDSECDDDTTTEISAESSHGGTHISETRSSKYIEIQFEMKLANRKDVQRFLHAFQGLTVSLKLIEEYE